MFQKTKHFRVYNRDFLESHEVPMAVKAIKADSFNRNVNHFKAHDIARGFSI